MFRKILLVLCLLACRGHSIITWTTPAQIIDTTANSFTDFQITEDAFGNAVCAWFDDNGAGADLLKAAYSTDYGQTWGAIKTFTSVGAGPYTDLRLAISDDGSGNASIIFASGNDLYKTYYNKATTTWVDDPPLLLLGSTATPFTTTSIKMKGTNGVYAAVLDIGFFNAPRVFTTVDYGATWILAPGWSFFYFTAPPYYIDIDFEGTNIMCVVHIIRTLNVWEPLKAISNATFGVGAWLEQDISVGKRDTDPKVKFTSNTGQDILVTWKNDDNPLGAPDTTIYENHTSDFGTTWAGLAVGTKISPTGTGATANQMGANPNGESIVVWQEGTSIKENHTSDNGATWAGGALGTIISGTDSATTPQIDMKLNFGTVFWLLTGGTGAHAAETIDSGDTWGGPSDPLVGSAGPFQTQQITIGSNLMGIIGNGQKTILTSYGIVTEAFDVFATKISKTRFYLQNGVFSKLTSNPIPDAVKFRVYSDAGLTNLVGETFGTSLDFILGGLNPTGAQTYYVTWLDYLNNESAAVEVTVTD